MSGAQYAVFALFCGLGGALIAHVKGNPRLIWFMICALLPFIGIIAALFSRSDMDEPRRRCETCGRVLPVTETLCTGCGTDLDFPDEQLPSLRDEMTRKPG